MANIKIKNLDKVFAAIKEAIGDLPESMYTDIEKITVERIVAKARTGKTMASGKEEKLKPLKDSTIKSRKYKQERGLTDGEFFSPKRSNLTETGQYLRSFKRSKLDRKNARLTIEPEGTRQDGKLTNKKLAGYLNEQGRSVFGLDKIGKQRIFQRVKEELRRRLKRK